MVLARGRANTSPRSARLQSPDVVERATLVGGAAGDPERTPQDDYARGVSRIPRSVRQLTPALTLGGVPDIVHVMSLPVEPDTRQHPDAIVEHREIRPHRRSCRAHAAARRAAPSSPRRSSSTRRSSRSVFEDKDRAWGRAQRAAPVHPSPRAGHRRRARNAAPFLAVRLSARPMAPRQPPASSAPRPRSSRCPSDSGPNCHHRR